MSVEVSDLLRRGESAALEFKSSLSDSRRIIETVAAMATIGGGVILVGVRPDGRPVGSELQDGDLERLVQRILAHTDPRLFVDLDRPEVDGERLLRIRVPAGDGPHLAFGRAFYRSGPATVAMTRDEYERRLLDRLRESSGFERRTEGTLEDVDPEAVERFLARVRDRGLLESGPPREVITRLHLARGDAVAVGALLLFGRWPQGPLPQATIRARAIRGAAEDASAVEGTVFEQIDRAAAFVARNLKLRPDRTGLRRQEVPELPLPAVREVLTNAVAHRDYRSTAPIQVRLTDRGLAVWNPGHFPPPITPALLRREHPSVPTNPLVARALHLAGYVEEWGTGTLRVIRSMEEHGNPAPLFEEEAGGIRVVLPLSGVMPAELVPRQAAFLTAQPAGEAFTTAGYARSQGVAHRTALGDLRGLERLGLVRREGRGKATRWVRA